MSKSFQISSLLGMMAMLVMLGWVYVHFEKERVSCEKRGGQMIRTTCFAKGAVLQ